MGLPRQVACATAIIVGVSLAPLAASQNAPHALASADAAMNEGEYAAAAAAYEAWLASHPESSDVLFALGVCYIQQGQSPKAIEPLRRYVRLQPDAAKGHALLGIALLDGAHAGEARIALERAIALDRSQSNAVEALARLELVAGNAAGAVSLLRPLVAADGGGDARTLMGEALIRAGDAAGAADMLERDLAAQPQPSIQTYVFAAWARIKTGDLERAADICEQGMRRHPDSEIEGVYLSLPAPLLAKRTAARLERLQAAQDVNELIALGRVLTDVDPGRKTRANEIAQKLLAQAVALAPGSASAHYNYGRALRQTDLKGALAEWERALALGPADELRLQILTRIATATDASDAASAERAFQAAHDINRRLARRAPEPALEYVRFLKLQSRSAEAEAILNEVVSWNPWSPEVHVERARLFADNGRWQDVVRDAEFVLQSAQDNRELLRVAHLLLARAYYRLGQSDKAQVHRAWIESH